MRHIFKEFPNYATLRVILNEEKKAKENKFNKSIYNVSFKFKEFFIVHADLVPSTWVKSKKIFTKNCLVYSLKSGKLEKLNKTWSRSFLEQQFKHFQWFIKLEYQKYPQMIRMEEMNRETVFTSDCVPRWSLPTTNHSSMSSSPLKSNSTP